jgi:iron complex transport system substrate-binding protein
MKIWSLLPSATEILFALGLGDQVTGVTHECDYPPEAARKPRVTVSFVDSSRRSREIGRQVSDRLQRGQQLYGIDEGRLRADPPGLIVTQDLCPVCAVSPSDFAAHMEAASCSARVVTLNPHLLNDVLDNILEAGRATGRLAQAQALVERLDARIEGVREAVAGAPRPRVLCLEWLDPLMPGGHWAPGMVEIAGGVSEPLRPGEESRKVAWGDLRAFEPEVVVLMPCGFGTERALDEAGVLRELPGWEELPAVKQQRVYATDANAYFSRPGPRLIEGLEILAHILHPDRFPKEPPPGSFRPMVHRSPQARWSPRTAGGQA